MHNKRKDKNFKKRKDKNFLKLDSYVKSSQGRIIQTYTSKKSQVKVKEKAQDYLTSFTIIEAKSTYLLHPKVFSIFLHLE